jgi:pyruvate/2-oxoglutarate dehydrogenase complex dihydrolipoamide acyltransferase (E2) component
MVQDVIMPKLGMYLEDVRLVEWLWEEGAEVKPGDLIFVLETDKVTTEVEADAPGFLHRIVPADSMVPIGAVVGRIAADRAEYEELAAGGRTGGLAEDPAPTERAGPEFEAAQSELFLDYIRTAGGDEETGGAFEPEAAPAERARRARGGRPVSPRARALIAEQGREPDVVESIPASGPGGRLTDKDVRAFLEQGGAGRGPAGEAPERSPLVEVAVAERIPLRGARRVIARRMLESLQTTAQLTSILELDVDAVVSWRERSQPRVSYTTIFAALVAQALRRHPLLNSRIADDAIEVLADVNVAFAVNTSDGVIVPVVRGVDTLGLADLDTVVSELTERARGGTLTLAELDGGTFTLSNSGNARVDITTAIINPPQAAILWLGRIRERPAAHQGAVVVRPTVQACLTYDHRIVDGVPAAEFLGTLEDLCRTLPPLFS